MPQSTPMVLSEKGRSGSKSKLNINTTAAPPLGFVAPVQVTTGPSRLSKISMFNPGSSGSWVIRDGLDDTAPIVWQEAFDSPILGMGKVLTLDWPFKTGIRISSVGVGGSCSISYNGN